MLCNQTASTLGLSLVELHCSPEDVGQPIDTVLHPGLQLMQQHLTLGGRQLTLVVPRSIDAVLDMYIARGMPCFLCSCASNLGCHIHMYSCFCVQQPACTNTQHTALPTWLWHCAVHLNKHLLCRRHLAQSFSSTTA